MCFKLIKWAAIGIVAVAGLGYFVFGEHLGSYAQTMTNSVREGVRGKIPIEFELKRAGRLIREIEPEITECKRDVARAEVELEHLVDQVARLEKRVAKQEGKLKSGCDLLGNATPASYEFGGQHYSRRRIELDLERTFEAYKNNKALLKGKKMLIERQSRAVEAARSKLDAVRAEKVRLDHTIATLKAQKRQVDALAASSHRFDLDDTALSKAKEVLANVKTRLDVAQRMIEDDIFFTEGIQSETTPNRDIVKEIGEHFSGPVAESSKNLTERGSVRRVETR
ncbi:MAG: hypothetical protein ACYTGW_11325 [Planctomycetota bacterium]|jgi:predicted  nucleic acid-binding Zn-ribbon protein